MTPADPIIWTIRGYQKLISRHTPPVCRFHPSCSHYAVEALHVHGVVRGSWLSAYRIARCNPFVAGGFDPVPPARSLSIAGGTNDETAVAHGGSGEV